MSRDQEAHRQAELERVRALIKSRWISSTVETSWTAKNSFDDSKPRTRRLSPTNLTGRMSRTYLYRLAPDVTGQIGFDRKEDALLARVQVE